jgi:hypothetical protein
MMQYKTPIWFCIPPLIKWLTEARNRQTELLAPDVHSGINFSIILNSACYIEGALESGVWALLDQRLHEEDPLCAALKDDLKRRFSREFTGAEGYNELFKLVVGVAASDLPKSKPLWEGVVSLFHLRNLLAHGRAITHELDFHVAPGSRWQEKICGPTTKARKYLLKKKLIPPKPTPLDDEWFFLTDQVADHLSHLATVVIVAIGESLSGQTKKVFQSATGPGIGAILGSKDNVSFSTRDGRLLQKGRSDRRRPRDLWYIGQGRIWRCVSGSRPLEQTLRFEDLPRRALGRRLGPRGFQTGGISLGQCRFAPTCLAG